MLQRILLWLLLFRLTFAANETEHVRKLDVPLDFSPGLPLLHLPALGYKLGQKAKLLKDPTSKMDDGTSSSSNNNNINIPKKSMDASKLFVVNGTSLVLRRSFIDLSSQGLDLLGVVLDIDLRPPSSHKGLPRMSVRVRPVQDVHELCSPGPRMCFFTKEAEYRLPDSFLPGSAFDVLVHPVPLMACPDDFKVHYSIHSGQEAVNVDPSMGTLVLATHPDLDTGGYRFRVFCSVRVEGHVSEHVMDGHIRIYDVNNHGPYLQPGRSGHFDIDVADVQTGRPLPEQFNVLDRDSPRVNDIRVSLEDDVKQFFKVQVETVFPKAIDGAMLLHAGSKIEGTRVVNTKQMAYSPTRNNQPPGKVCTGADTDNERCNFVIPIKEVVFPGPSYNFKVVFEDHGLTVLGRESKVIFTVRIFNNSDDNLPVSGSHLYTSLARTASLHSQLSNLSFVRHSRRGYRFDLELPKGITAFNITPKTGIVYVSDLSSLRSIRNTSVVLRVRWSSTPNKGHYVITVELTGDSGNLTASDCAQSCSVHYSEFQCRSSCGRGSLVGTCFWRPSQGLGNLTSAGYATCTPSQLTCPDGRCDELEKQQPSLCPQDCAQNVQGEVVPGRDGGIRLGRGICFCPLLGFCSCQTQHNDHLLSNEVEEEEGFDYEDISRDGYLLHRPLDVKIADDYGFCGPTCLLVILSVGCGSFLLVCLLFFALHRQAQVSRLKKQATCVRFPLTVMPSDYVDERNMAAVAGPATSRHNVNGIPRDPRWEFPRDKLLLEQVLGEGEFGRVVRARAWAIAGLPGYTTVAVKMLKEGCSCSDREDLLSELNLLKDVEHPNVIRLLGACTKSDGPLMVIVEYAELGCLRDYLRNLRQVHQRRSSQAWMVENPGYLTEESHLSQKELLSFAWQIARGMEYLSRIKVVHRDLATRNILLGKGKVVKISDFGLSRDVYERETYSRKSKGRLPVKWMALESLQDQIYTTKSDVWSYGVMLWEIVTLGSSPYPGITPERLFQILKAGYRMERPESCSIEIYELMCSCWRPSPSIRPCFRTILQNLDVLLQQTAVYIQLDRVALGQDEDEDEDDDEEEEEEDDEQEMMIDDHTELLCGADGSTSIVSTSFSDKPYVDYGSDGPLLSENAVQNAQFCSDITRSKLNQLYVKNFV